MIVRQVRLSNKAKDQLSRLKGKTSIQQWNILCRWALCLSLKEPSVPPDIDEPTDSNVEISWHVFGGEHHELFTALVKQRCIQDGLGSGRDTVAKYFKLHLHRGISYLASPGYITSCPDLLELVLEKED